MINNPILNTIFQRKSIRKFTSEKISREKIEYIIRAGQMAPTACKMEPYSFIIISDEDIKNQIINTMGNHKPTREFMEQAASWIMICVDFARQIKLLNILNIKNNFSEISKLILGVIDAALAAENMVLAAESFGLGSCFVGSIWTAPKKIATILNLPENVLPILLLCIGYPNENPLSRPRWPIKNVLHENEYSMPDEKSIMNYIKTKSSWEITSPYKLSKEVEQNIVNDFIKLGFPILNSTNRKGKNGD
jgi:nitroreductase